MIFMPMLIACGQEGPLYLPTESPLIIKPNKPSAPQDISATPPHEN